MDKRKFSVGDVRYICNAGENPKKVVIVAIGKDFVEIQYSHGGKNKFRRDNYQALLTEIQMLEWKQNNKPKTPISPIKPKSNGYQGRTAHCYRCRASISSNRWTICPLCKWIRCYRCGACGCNKND